MGLVARGLVVAKVFVAIGVLSGAAIAQEIVIGQTLPLSGPSASHGREAMRGADAFVKSVNASGGVNGRKLALKTLDDQLTPDKAVANTRALASEHKAVALVSATFAPSITAMAPVATELTLPMVGALNGNGALRDEKFGILTHVRPSFVKELEKTTTHYTTIGAKRFGLFHPNDTAGLAAGKLMADALKAKGLTAAADVAFDRASTDFHAYAKQLLDANVEVVVISGPVKSAAELIKAIRSKSSAVLITCLSTVDDRGLFEQLKDAANGVTFSSVVPNPYEKRNPLVQEYQAAMTKAGYNEFSLTSMESYINTRLAVDAIKRTGGNLSRERLQSTLKQMPDLTYGDVRLFMTRGSAKNGLETVDMVMLKRDGSLAR
jgi:branched-chain amino acid transport system substrate-binding protein